MGKNKNNALKNAQNNQSDLKNHNERRKAQDSSHEELKNSQEFIKFD